MLKVIFIITSTTQTFVMMMTSIQQSIKTSSIHMMSIKSTALKQSSHFVRTSLLIGTRLIKMLSVGIVMLVRSGIESLIDVSMNVLSQDL